MLRANAPGWTAPLTVGPAVRVGFFVVRVGLGVGFRVVLVGAGVVSGAGFSDAVFVGRAFGVGADVAFGVGAGVGDTAGDEKVTTLKATPGH